MVCTDFQSFKTCILFRILWGLSQDMLLHNELYHRVNWAQKDTAKEQCTKRWQMVWLESWQNGQLGEATLHFFVFHFEENAIGTECILFHPILKHGEFSFLVKRKGSGYTLRRSDESKPWSVSPFSAFGGGRFLRLIDRWYNVLHVRFSIVSGGWLVESLSMSDLLF